MKKICGMQIFYVHTHKIKCVHPPIGGRKRFVLKI
jgi:hypothetical protein